MQDLCQKFCKMEGESVKDLCRLEKERFYSLTKKERKKEIFRGIGVTNWKTMQEKTDRTKFEKKDKSEATKALRKCLCNTERESRVWRELSIFTVFIFFLVSSIFIIHKYQARDTDISKCKGASLSLSQFTVSLVTQIFQFFFWFRDSRFHLERQLNPKQSNKNTKTTKTE